MAEIIKTHIKLNAQEQQVLQTLSRKGAMQPSQLAAETLIVPGEINTLLASLADVKFVIVRDDNTPDGKVVILTGDGKNAVEEGLTSQSSSA